MWVINLACQKPKDLSYTEEVWTTRLPDKHLHQHCIKASHPNLAKRGWGTVSKILSDQPVRPHKVEYYLERRDPEFDAKMAQVLQVYRNVAVWRKQELLTEVVRSLSYDEKPGIQAIGHTAGFTAGTWSIPIGRPTMNASVTGRCHCWTASIC